MTEIKKPQSPAERAKEFALDNGFIIEPVGRRYRITRNNMHNVTIAEVGGYPAALNAMKTQVRADELAMCIEFESKPVEMCAGGTLVLPEPSTDPALNATANDMQIISGPDAGKSVNSAEWLGDDFDSFNTELQARIRQAANRIARKARKLSGKPPGGPWHVIFNGRQLTKPGYPSRAEAVAVVRWGFNHPEPHIRNNWRTARLAVEYRA